MTSVGGKPASLFRAGVGVVRNTRSMALSAALTVMLIRLASALLRVKTSLRLLTEYRVGPGYQASAPKNATIMIHARTIYRRSPAWAPCCMFPRVRRCSTTFIAFPVQCSTWLRKERRLSRKTPSHLVASLGRILKDPSFNARLVDPFLRVKC